MNTGTRHRLFQIYTDKFRTYRTCLNYFNNVYSRAFLDYVTTALDRCIEISNQLVFE